jgi:hypothetical protein
LALFCFEHISPKVFCPSLRILSEGEGKSIHKIWPHFLGNTNQLGSESASRAGLAASGGGGRKEPGEWAGFR